MSSTTSPALPAFSYAQAARGLNTTRVSQPNSTQSGNTPSEKGSKDGRSSSQEASNLELTPTSIEARRDESNLQDSTREKSSAVEPSAIVTKAVSEKENIPLSSAPEKFHPEAKDSESAPQNNSASTITSKHEETSAVHSVVSDAWEKDVQVSTDLEKPANVIEKTKNKDTDDDWEKVSATNLFEKELKAAPVPVVNIWQQRMEAQEAKAREQAALRGNVAASSTKPKPQTESTELPKRKSTDKGPAMDRDMNGSGKKGSESFRGITEGRRESTKGQPVRPNSKDGPTNEQVLPPPAVGDAVSWPTPDTIGAEERRKSAGPDKAEKGDGKASSGKKWERVPFVPTVKFETALPPVARRGGRGGNRGRDNTSRGAHTVQNSVSGEKTDGSGSMGPPPPRSSQEQERGRKQESSRVERANSVPTQTRKSVSANGVQDGSSRMPEFKTERKGGQDYNKANNDAARITRAQEDLPSTSTEASRSSSRPTEQSGASQRSNNAEAKKQNTIHDDEQVQSSTFPTSRGGTFGGQYKETYGSTTSRFNGETGKEAPFSRSHDYTREKSESSRDKVESWRDREIQTESSSRRELRAERGRGSYRGRGVYTAYHVPLGNHAMSAPLPQQPFPTPRSYSNNEGRHRQSSQQYGYIQPVSNARGGLRSQSIPTTAVPHSMANGMPALSQPLSPLQTDMTMYGYPQALHPGIMSAMPYNTALDTYALFSMVASQLEYYFSLDNLCKDIFLRSNMDSQGYVPLRVIAGFKRIKSLTEDMDMLRHACNQSENIEFRPGENGDDLVRPRRDWNQWVLPNMGDRQAHARNEGPPELPEARRNGQKGQWRPNEPYFGQSYPIRSPVQSWEVESYNVAAPFVPLAISQGAFPTVEGHLTESPAIGPGYDRATGQDLTNEGDFREIASNASLRSPTTPGLNGVNANRLSNGTHPPTQRDNAEDENVFPDNQISTLYVYKREEPGLLTTERPPFMTNPGRTLSQDSRPDNDNNDESFVDNLASGLRGGAASPRQLENSGRLRSKSPIRDNNGIFWLKDGVSQNDFDRQGSMPWLYQSIHDRALEQRVPGYVNSDLEILYQFWSGFLVDNFNASMYEDFQTLAMEDLRLGMTSGSNHLANFYGTLLIGEKPITDRIARDIVHLAAHESGDHRPAFQKLRSAWRNGAFNLKSRKKIDNILDSNFRAELEK